MSQALQLEQEEAGRLASRLTDDVRQAAADAQPHWDAVQRNRALLKSEQPRRNPPWEGASELVVPYVKQAKFALLAHFCPTLLGPDPIFHVEGMNAAATQTADELERFLQAQLTREVKFRRVLERLFDAALRDGTAIAHVTWATVRRPRQVYEQVLTPILDEQSGALLVAPGSVRAARRVVTVYDAPRIDPIPVERFGTFPLANADIQESPGVFVRVAVTGEEILQRAARGDFDAPAVARLRELPGDSQAGMTPDQQQRQLGEGRQDQEFHSRSYTLTHIYYRYATASDGPAEDWVFTLHETSGILLEARPSPWFHQQRPFVAISPYQDVDGFYGDSLAAAGAGHVQQGQTTLLRLAIDAAAIGVSPEMLVAASLGKHIGDIKKRRGPGGVIPFPDAFFENSAAKLQPFGNHGYEPSVVIPLLQLLDQHGQECTGVSDVLKGAANPGNVTATEAEQLLESSQKLVAFLTERLADGQAEIGRLLHQLNYQFQGNDGPQRLWQQVNGESGVTLFQAMQGDYAISASGVRDTNNRAILAQRALERIQLLQNEPMVMQHPERRYSLLYDALQASGTAQPERYLGPLTDWRQAPPMG